MRGGLDTVARARRSKRFLFQTIENTIKKFRLDRPDLPYKTFRDMVTDAVDEFVNVPGVPDRWERSVISFTVDVVVWVLREEYPAGWWRNMEDWQ